MELKINELTQGMYENILDLLPDGSMKNAHFQFELSKAAIAAGWVESDLDLNLRLNVVKVYSAIQQLWKDATVIPNA